MNAINKRMIGAIGGSLLVVAMAGSALAATKAASGGQAYSFSDASCFIRNPYGLVENNCGFGGEIKFWTVDVENRATGTKTLRVFGKSTGAAPQTTCAGIVLNVNGTLKSWTGHQQLPVGAAGWKTLTPNLSVASGENVQFECALSNHSPCNGCRGFVSNVEGF